MNKQRFFTISRQSNSLANRSASIGYFTNGGSRSVVVELSTGWPIDKPIRLESEKMNDSIRRAIRDHICPQ